MVVMGAMVQLSILVVTIAVHMIIVVAIGFPSMFACLKLVDDLEGVLVVFLIKVMVVVAVMWHVTMGHEPGGRVPESSVTRDDSTKQRMWVSEGALSKRTAMSM